LKNAKNALHNAALGINLIAAIPRGVLFRGINTQLAPVSIALARDFCLEGVLL
jgi:hypothetical protein